MLNLFLYEVYEMCKVGDWERVQILSVVLFKVNMVFGRV